MPWVPMAGLIATVALGAVAAGVTYPLLSFILERQGTAPGLIGLSAAMMPLGFIVSAYLTPALARRMGAARLAILCSILAAASSPPTRVRWSRSSPTWSSTRAMRCLTEEG